MGHGESYEAAVEHCKELITEAGTALTPEYEAELAREAEAGYDLSKVTPRKVGDTRNGGGDY